MAEALEDVLKKRACRRPEVRELERGRQHVGTCTLAPWSPEDQPPQPSPEGSPGRPRPETPQNSERSTAQPCPRCIAGESGHFTHTRDL
ncbi:uncharacterized protein C10orf143 homolog isoform X2 [Perognathus longimembris pacificus]|uniref:uncharacterized protein C10orf143 homolog isoform X2 n=1 Tax=Perognathus longimembris pacificus TaxID=214514 RepID=UPI002018DA7A|nr:uncharacterized protein C10orf143 homolog isoform X2 [Perognathus longimembris pacificus]